MYKKGVLSMPIPVGLNASDEANGCISGTTPSQVKVLSLTETGILSHQWRSETHISVIAKSFALSRTCLRSS
jgi:hypothetical protein